MQIYAWQIDPSPSQWGIDSLNTATPNLAHLPYPQPFKHRCLEYCYTKLGRSTGINLWKTITPNKFHIYIAQCTYAHGRLTHPLLQSTIDVWKTITPNKFHKYIAQCTYTHVRLTPPPVLQLTIDLWETITPDKFHIYSTMHIYPWQIHPTSLLQLSIDLRKTITPNMFHIWHNAYILIGRLTPPPPAIVHRSLENHYTKLVSYI